MFKSIWLPKGCSEQTLENSFLGESALSSYSARKHATTLRK